MTGEARDRQYASSDVQQELCIRKHGRRLTPITWEYAKRNSSISCVGVHCRYSSFTGVSIAREIEMESVGLGEFPPDSIIMDTTQ